MQIIPLASGSNGNCCFIEEKGSAILVDAGKSCKEIEKRLNSVGKSLENVSAILLTHSHSDHTSGASVISRKFGIPVYMTKETFCESDLSNLTRKTFAVHKKFSIGDIQVTPIPTSHNVASCGFVLNNFGIFTDTGTITPAMEAIFPKLRAVLLESNHDIDKLINGPYPVYLKQWILSDQGHLSNIHASSFIQKSGDNLSLALLGHLSGTNNTPELAKETYETLVKKKISCEICSRETVTGYWEI